VMLGNEDDISDAGLFQCRHPLLGIKLARIEYLRIGGAVAPFLIQKRVGSKMDNRAELQILPLHLLWGRPQVGGTLSVGSGERKENEEENNIAHSHTTHASMQRDTFFLRR